MLRSLAILTIVTSVATAAPLRPRDNVVRVEHRPADQNPTLGPTDAPVTAELFFVPGDKESDRAYQRLLELQSRHPHRLRVVFRVIERNAQVVVPIAALEAYAEGRFDAFMDALIAVKGGVRRDNLDDVATAAGMDPVRLDQALDRALDPDLAPAPIQENERRRLRAHGQNVPELLLNGQLIGQTLAAIDVDDLDTYYQAAYDQADQLLADGVPIRHLVEATERDAAPETAVTSYPAGPIDDAQPGDDAASDAAPPLLSTALDLTGLPSDGDADAPVEIIVLCNLGYDSCRLQLDLARKLLELYPKEVRVVWYPWYDVGDEASDDAAHLHAAAICAEQQGDGWKFIDELLRQVRIAAIRDVDGLIDAATRLSGIDASAETACLAGDADDDAHRRVAAAIAAGVRASPAIVIGGRVYLGGFTDWHAAAPIVDDELAPGLLERMVPSWDESSSP